MTKITRYNGADGKRPRFARLSFWGVLFGLLTVAVILPSCKTGNDPVSPQTGIQLQLDVMPLLLKADTLSSSTVWATLKVNGEPAPDSTAVYFLASPGKIDPVAYTRDGLAVVSYRSVNEPGIAIIVGQALAIRDTVRVTLY